MANPYDITNAFRAIENELMKSMIRNMRRHKAEETKEGYRWSMWQAEQLKALEQYKHLNQHKYKDRFSKLNDEMAEIIRQARQEGGMKQEIAILNAIKRGFKPGNSRRAAEQMEAAFFRINDRKLEALIHSTVHDMEKAERAILRRADDQYRKIIFNAQVYANTGSGTYEKAVDMATKDFLSKGIDCIEYANGARHTISDYVDMALRTASKRAYLQGEGEMRKKWGIATVIMNKRGNPCPKCLPFVGKVLIDDVWSGGTRKDGPYPLMSAAVSAGLYHPRCKDSHTTYFEGISTPPNDLTGNEVKKVEEWNEKESKKRYAKRQAERFGRLAKYSLDRENRQRYAVKRSEWENAPQSYKQREESHRGMNKGTAINKAHILSDEYVKKIQKLEASKELSRSILAEAKAMLTHRSGTEFEDLAFITGDGKVKRSVNYNVTRTAKQTKKMSNMLKREPDNSIIAIHNHPNSTPPSFDDLKVAELRRYKYGIAVCHDGALYKYKVTGDLSAVHYETAVARLQKKGYNKSEINRFVDNAKKAGVEMEVLR